MLNKIIKGDKLIWLVVALLFLFSTVLIISCGDTLLPREIESNYYLIKNVKFYVIGFIITLVISRIPYLRWAKIIDILAIVTPLILIALLILGTSINGEIHWMKIGFITLDINVMVQCSLILFLPNAIIRFSETSMNAKDFLLKVAPLPTFVFMAFIINNDISMAFSTLIISGVIMLVSGIRPALLIGYVVTLFVLFLGIMTLITLSHLSLDQFLTRLQSRWAYNEVPEQLQQAYSAIKNGGLIGIIWDTNASGTLIYQGVSDFIFANIIEQFGIIGALLFVSLFAVLFIRLYKIAKTADTTYGSLLVSAINASIITQLLLHIFVVLGLFPITSQPMPFVPLLGFTSLYLFIQMGIVLNVSGIQESNKSNELVK